ncbi:MAG: sulfatase [Bryobacterales bacterium]|nr:sulfatase [Bryobacterales bacterium]
MGMNRRTFLSSLATAPMLGAQQRRPNVLFLAVDDLNDWVGCLGGHPQARTPNLDRLASRGVLFTNAHCNAPLCNPSRASLMTGIRPSTSGIYDNNQPMRKSPVLRDAVTLGQHFRAGGYSVSGAGKIFHGGYPDPQSWDTYFPSQTKNKPDDPVPPGLPLNGIPKTAHFDWGPVNVPDEKMGDAQVVDWTIEQLNRKHTQPFFLACGLFRPHLPWYVPPKYFDLFPLNSIVLPRVKDDDLDDVPPVGVKFAKPNGDHRKVIEHKQWRQAVQGYLASIAFMDAMLGRVLDAFDRSSHAQNTAVVLWSDHGWHLGEKLHWRKFSLWEEATRNVLTISAPGVTKANQRCGRPVTLLDLYPTLSELCGLQPNPRVEGHSLMPLLKNPQAAWDRPAVTTYLKDNHSVRSERWRYIRYSDGKEELYDHREDPQEWRNLAEQPAYGFLKRDLARWVPQVNAPESVHERGQGEDA